jgi:hypothetical protein
VVDSEIVPTRRFIAFLPPVPSLAIDQRSRRIYVAFEDGRSSPSDVDVWSLGRGAAAWRGPTRVHAGGHRDLEQAGRFALASFSRSGQLSRALRGMLRYGGLALLLAGILLVATEPSKRRSAVKSSWAV